MAINPLDPSLFRPIVGIDLGTTNSAVAFIRNGQPQIIAAADGESLLPSVVLLDTNDQIVVGQDARDGLIAMPERSVAAVKRLMGSSDPIMLGNRQFLPEEISALILKNLYDRSISVFGEGPIEAVITVPAYFSDDQRRATKHAGELAGFVVERIINEPTAAALAYGLNHSEDKLNILVYDLGGGTFDVSVVALDNGVMEVQASNGNRQLGGEDFDWRLVDWMAEQVLKSHHVDPRTDLRSRAILKDLAERTKWALSDSDQATIESPVLLVHQDHPVTLNTIISRKIFVNMIQPWLDETFSLIDDVLQESHLTPDQIDQVLLVGGSTRIPRIGDMIAQRFNRAPRNEVDPDLAVALGAAVQAGLKSGALSESGLVATDIAPFSMGIAVARPHPTQGWWPGYFQPIIPRNTTIPCRRSESFTTMVDGQDTIEVEVFQGEHELVSHNHALGSFLLTGIPKAPAGTERIMVTFRYNLNGILEATAEILSTRSAKTIVVQDGLERHSLESLQQSQQRLQALWAGESVQDQEFFEVAADELLDPPDFDIAADLQGDPEQLQTEAQAAIDDLVAMIDEKRGNGRRARILLTELKEALASQNPDRILAALNQATDLLFESQL